MDMKKLVNDLVDGIIKEVEDLLAIMISDLVNKFWETDAEVIDAIKWQIAKTVISELFKKYNLGGVVPTAKEEETPAVE